MSFRVVINPEARADLLNLYEYIANQGFPDRAFQYAARIEEFCVGLRTFPQRGRPIDHFRPGVRTVTFERRASIVFEITPDELVILRILYGGRDLNKIFKAK